MMQKYIFFLVIIIVLQRDVAQRHLSHICNWVWRCLNYRQAGRYDNWVKIKLWKWVLFGLYQILPCEAQQAQSPAARQLKWQENTAAEVTRLSNRGNVMMPLMETESRLLSLMAPLLISVCISALPAPVPPRHEWTKWASNIPSLFS